MWDLFVTTQMRKKNVISFYMAKQFIRSMICSILQVLYESVTVYLCQVRFWTFVPTLQKISSLILFTISPNSLILCNMCWEKKTIKTYVLLMYTYNNY